MKNFLDLQLQQEEFESAREYNLTDLAVCLKVEELKE